MDASLEGRGIAEAGESVVDVPLVGPVDVAERSLLVSTLLIGFVVMVTLAVVMLVRPTLLETVGGALVVFGCAAGIASVGLLVDRAVRLDAGTIADRPSGER